MKKHMLTTLDNPWNPWSHFDEWYAYDEQAGYHTSSLLARVTITSLELSEADQDLALEYAIDEICQENVLGIYRKVLVPESETGDSGDVAA